MCIAEKSLRTERSEIGCKQLQEQIPSCVWPVHRYNHTGLRFRKKLRQFRCGIQTWQIEKHLPQLYVLLCYWIQHCV